MDAAYPTRFAAPFRAADASDMMPDLPAGTGSMSKDQPVDATLLRSHPATRRDEEPLFARQLEPAATTTPSGTPTSAIRASRRSATSFSTTSNVFAVWMTVGTSRWSPPRGLPQRRYDDPGETWPRCSRQRTPGPTANAARKSASIPARLFATASFYIIDRSVPVGFQPGQKHNTDDCILLRRFIE